MKMAYERIVAAAMKREGSLWEIGDEIIKVTGSSRDEQGKTTGLFKKIKAIAEELESNGLEKYDEKSLSSIRITAIVFRGNDRIPEVGFHTHRIAGTPEKLKNVIEYAASVGRTKPVTPSFIKEYEAEEKGYRREAQRKRSQQKKRQKPKKQKQRRNCARPTAHRRRPQLPKSLRKLKRKRRLPHSWRKT
jgi:hypothetical protein